MEIARHWRLKAQRYRFIGSICPGCEQVTFPPRLVCPHCNSKMVERVDCVPVAFPMLPRQVDQVSSERMSR